MLHRTPFTLPLFVVVMVLSTGVFAILLPFFSILQAGGGRTLVYTASTNLNRGTAGKNGVVVLAQMFRTEPNTNDFSSNERAEFRIDNPKPGQYCSGFKEHTNELGGISAVCFSNEVGSYTVYVYSFDRQDESMRYILYFDAPLTPSPKPSPKPSARPSLKSSASPSTSPIQDISPLRTPLPSSSPQITASLLPTSSPEPSQKPSIFSGNEASWLSFGVLGLGVAVFFTTLYRARRGK